MDAVATPVIAALLAFFYILLTANVIRTRAAEKVGIGHGESRLLERRVRAHGNFAEYAPFGVVLLLLVELAGSPINLVWSLGAALILGRLVHAYSLNSLTLRPKCRIAGMILTLGSIGLTAVTLAAMSVS